ncbi:uncharacterized protein PSFLO_00742 [Pseudozyma flocculosa]|uniref:LIM zinc-binding domain-containing protein n=1 Tax=Pseudozyma flocculosa TaxID=84751 RepID=A0A5C3EVZ3_9BASI|nr:uncharacterized protein PSFLO_00742 [Pseudozyma flocculosa]
MPRFSVPAAPKCAKCAQSVYHVEQVIGPMAKTYHKHCLTCTVCAKRLDSTLLVEHDGEPFCKNCHKEHLGTGKGGFTTAVKLNPVSPKAQSASSPRALSSPRTLASPTPSSSSPATNAFPRSPSPTKPQPSAAFPHGLEDQGVTGISIRPRGQPTSPTTTTAAATARPSSPSKVSSRPYVASRATPSTPIRSIDDAVSSTHPHIRDPVSNLVDSVGGLGLQTIGNDTEDHETDDEPRKLPSASYYATPPPRAGHSFDSTSSTATPSRTSFASPAATSTTSTLASPAADAYDPPVTITTRRISAADTIGSTLNGAAGIAKVAPPRMTINPNTTTSPDRLGGPSGARGLPSEGSDSSLNGRAAKGGIERLGLGSIISDAGGGTPLCARCQKPVYFAEQKAAAGRKWHRACLRCDGCSTTLDTGKLEEGPVDRTYKGGANIWCRVCYAKYFGPKNLAVGFSLPDTLPP